MSCWLRGCSILLVVPILALYSSLWAQTGDRDGDGIHDAADRCPDLKETKNGFNDEDGCPDSFDQAFDLFTKDVDDYWRGLMPELGGEYEPPDALRLYDTFLVTPCGDTVGSNNAAFSTCRRRIYFHRPFMLMLFAQGDYIPAVVAAHEWGHLGQYTLGLYNVLPPGYFRELHADCLAGSYTRYVEDAESKYLRLSEGDVDEALLGLFRFGDTMVPWLNPQYHGTGGERIDAFNWGYKYKADSCNGSVFLARFGNVRDQLGLAIPTGRLGEAFPDPALARYQLVDCDREDRLIGRKGTTDAIKCEYESPEGSIVTMTLVAKTSPTRAAEMQDSNVESLRGKGWSIYGSGNIKRGSEILGRISKLRKQGHDIFMYTIGSTLGYIHGPTMHLKIFSELLFPPID